MALKRPVLLVLVAMAAAPVFGCGTLELAIDAMRNRQLPLNDEPAPGQAAKALVKTAFVADLHADTLLFERGLEGKMFNGERVGFVDVQRLVENDVSLQVLSTVSEYSFPVRATLKDRNGNPVETRCNRELSDHGQASFGGWPVDLVSVLYRMRHPLSASTKYGDLQERVLDQADRFDRYLERSKTPDFPHKVEAIKSAGDLSAYLETWRRGGEVRGVILAIEGLHFYRDGSLDTLWERGFRMASLTHHFDNQLAASSTGCHDEDDPETGLKPRGREALAEMREKGWVLDLAHAAGATVGQALDQWTQGRPPVVSHTGVQGMCDGAFSATEDDSDCRSADRRNVSAEDAVRVAKAGGVIGIMYWPEAVEPRASDVGEEVLTGIVDSMTRLHDMLAAYEASGTHCPTGAEPDCIHGKAADYIALGSDWDAAIAMPIGTGNIEVLVNRLLQVPCGDVPGTCDPERNMRFSESDIRAILGWNVCRVLMQSLPGGVDRTEARQTCYGLTRAPV